jgi:hypothetical protein
MSITRRNSSGSRGWRARPWQCVLRPQRADRHPRRLWEHCPFTPLTNLAGQPAMSVPLCRPRSGSEPTCAARRADLGLLGRVLERWLVAFGHRGRAAQEVDVDLADEPVAELGVADCPPLRTAPAARRRRSRRRRRRPRPARPTRRRSRPWGRSFAGTYVAEDVDVGKSVLRLVWSTGTQPSIARPEAASGSGARCTRIPDEQLVGHRLAARQLRRAGGRGDAGHQVLGELLDGRAARPSRNICETSPVAGTGRFIGNVVAICTASRLPCCVNCSCNRNDPLERRRRDT